MSKFIRNLSAFAFAFALIAGEIARSYAALDVKKPW